MANICWIAAVSVLFFSHCALKLPDYDASDCVKEHCEPHSQIGVY